MRAATTFRCACCGFSLPASYEGDPGDGRCFLCVPLTDNERRVMERAFTASERSRRARAEGRRP